MTRSGRGLVRNDHAGCSLWQMSLLRATCRYPGVDETEAPSQSRWRWVPAALAALACAALTLAAVAEAGHAGQLNAGAERATAVSDSFQDALYAATVEQSLERAYQLRPARVELRWFDRTGDSLEKAL